MLLCGAGRGYATRLLAGSGTTAHLLTRPCSLLSCSPWALASSTSCAHAASARHCSHCWLAAHAAGSTTPVWTLGGRVPGPPLFVCLLVHCRCVFLGGLPSKLDAQCAQAVAHCPASPVRRTRRELACARVASHDVASQVHVCSGAGQRQRRRRQWLTAVEQLCGSCPRRCSMYEKPRGRGP